METYYDSINRYDTVDIVSLSAVLDSEELNKVNNYINSNDYWSKEYNCTTFAAEAWNLISSYTFTFSGTPYPINLSNQIKKYNYQTNKNLDYNMPTGYYDGDSFVERIGYHI